MKRIKDDQPVRAQTCEPAQLDAVKGGWEDGGWGDYGGDWSGGNSSGLFDFSQGWGGNWYDDGQSCVIPEDYLCC